MSEYSTLADNLNSYEQRQQARRERFQELAEKARSESNAAYSRFRSIGDMIPMGQPILVGHHSEGMHRRHIAKMDNAIRKSCELDSKAKYYEDKAASVGKGGVSSDDPDATDKLAAQLEDLERSQERMKAANAVIKKKSLSDDEKVRLLTEQGLTASQATKLLQPDFCGRIGFPAYALTNNNANIRRIKQRITELQARSSIQEAEPIEGEGFTITEDASDNRIHITFGSIPSPDVRTMLKRSGWKWSPTRSAWVRNLNNAGRYSARMVAEQLRATA